MECLILDKNQGEREGAKNMNTVFYHLPAHGFITHFAQNVDVK